jgi:predicted nucleic acid-binding protein
MQDAPIAVSNTSPLNYLIRLGKPEVLREIYGRILVPAAVLRELNHPEAPSAVRSWVNHAPSWFEESPVTQVDPDLPAKLGPGEREAICLALERDADVLVIDDYSGRVAAENRNITINGTLFVVLEASLRGYLDFPETMEKLRQLGFRVSRAVEENLFVRYERAKRQSRR